MNSVILESASPGVAIVKISRPQALNALNTETLLELKEVLTKIAYDTSVRAVVLTGDGEKAFIAGADIAEMKDMTMAEGVRFSQLGHEATKLLELMPKPTIAAVNGFALGGGTELAIACDFIIASDKAVFGQPEVGLGIIPGFGGTLRLAKFVGYPRAKELIFSGRRVKAEEALRIGLANEIVPAANLMNRALEVAQDIASQSATAVAAAKRLLTEFSESVGLNFKLDSEAQSFGQLLGTADQREGMTAFIEKRKPAFVGKQGD
ncbi:MAG: crotonase [Bdellovibrionales bacterium GWB1_55_8]|nr:MAG: crotonase [Bdellovibrionales bacterium GWB1_55_8]